ncbi:MAG: efflux RND transporter permease subunit [Verrucomicrobia bacterium]|nr:efflux RND transporter permease subunit [Verrucomicrobiota bacterium]
MNAIVEFALKQRVFVGIAMVFLFGAGAVSFSHLNIEAYPDPVPPLVEVITQSTGQSAEEIERYITIPIEIQMAGIQHVTAVRTISLFGLSDVRVHFNYDVTYEQAEQLVINRLSQLSALPNGATPQISPESPIGEIYRYRLVGPPGYSVMDLKTIQDWILERRFKAVPGVVDVTGWGGKTKTYEVTVDQHKLTGYGLTVPQVIQALNNANINVGGQTVNFGPQAAVVRGVGLIHSMDDIRNTMLSANGGSPIRIRDVATVQVGHQPRLGIAGQDNDNDIAQGIVLMRRGEQSLPTIRRVEAEVDKINTSGILPPGVRLEKIYDRSELIAITTHTVLHNLIFGIVLIFVIQWVFLGDLRSAVIVAATIPFALFFAIIIMMLRGESANLLSVGAIDFGLIVDATVIMVENIYRHLAQKPDERFAHAAAVQRIRPTRELPGKLAVIANSALEVNRAIFFSAAVIIAGFIPLFTLSGVEGHIFGPMAKTYAYAIAGGLMATFTITPALSALLLPDEVKETEAVIVRILRRIYTPILEFTLANRIVSLGAAAALAVSALVAARSLGLEFLPRLEEGNFWIRASFPPTISLEEAQGYANRMRQIVKTFPEVQTVISQLGRPDDGTDSSGFFNLELNVPLKPFDRWPPGVDKERLTRQMNAALEWPFPGVDFNFSQNIEDNVEEAASGVKGQNSIKLYGNDLEALQKTAYQIKAILGTVQGMTDLSVFDAVGQPTVNIDIDRNIAARYGLAPGDVNSTVQAAIGGQAAGNLYEYGSDRNFPIVVRLAPQYRQSLDAMRHIPIGAPNPSGNGTIPVYLDDTARINLVPGYSFIYRENQERYIPLKFSVRGRDLGSAVLEGQRKIADQVRLPPGSRLEWVGEFGELQDALERLKLVVPITLLLIVMLLLANFSSIVDTLLAASVMPMALIGGIFALKLTGTPFSVSAAIGFIGLFGISVMEGIIVIAYFNQMIDGGLERSAALLRACQIRLRPVMMTCVAACVGLLPAAVSTGIGSQVQKPLALVVVGGILLAPVLILINLPVLIDLFSRRRVPAGGEAPAKPEPQPAKQ